MALAENSAFQGMFLGEFDHALDPQCRVTLPSSWRSADGLTELVMSPARGNTLQLIPVQRFRDFFDSMAKKSITNPKLQLALAKVGASARECRCDKQGRVALDRKKLDEIGVTNMLKLIGGINHIQLMAPENWQSPTNDETLDTFA